METEKAVWPEGIPPYEISKFLKSKLISGKAIGFIIPFTGKKLSFCSVEEIKNLKKMTLKKPR